MSDAIDPIGDNTPQDNMRFKAEDPLSFTDLLTRRTYKVVSVGETDPTSPELAASHLIKTVAKAIISLNKQHQNDYFWGEMSPSARKALKDLGIRNMNDLLNNIDNLVDVPQKSLVQIIKMIVGLK